MDELEPTGVVGPLKAGLQIVRSVQRWMDGPDRGGIYRDHYEEWIADLARRVAEHAQHGGEIAERLDALEQDRERVLVVGNYGLEAWREANDRRRAMLGDAVEAAILSELTGPELARVERTIRMLDPEDLDLLLGVHRAIEQVHERFGKSPSEQSHYFIEGTKTPEAMRERAIDFMTPSRTLAGGHLGGAALIASGCVYVQSPLNTLNVRGGEYGRVAVTPIGALVLRFMGRR